MRFRHDFRGLEPVEPALKRKQRISGADARNQFGATQTSSIFVTNAQFVQGNAIVFVA